MSWNFVPNDDFDLEQLYKMRDFFEQDLEQAREYLRKVQNFTRRMKLKTDWAVKMAQSDVKVSKENLAKVNQAIIIAEGKAHKYETKFKNKPDKKELEEIKERDKKWAWF